MDELFSNRGDPDQMPQNAVSDLGLDCLPVTHLVFSGLTTSPSDQINIFKFYKYGKEFCPADTQC